ncbi:MAG: hypothetical protein HC826_02615 [Rhodospirillales bacterium]|nr:hypothetical protein [Rhodospirillales bacterium]
MKFGPVPVGESVGCVLAHSLETPVGRMRKGRLLCGEDIAVLRAAGIDEIVVARLESDDVGEDAAAAAVAAALAGADVEVGNATTGRCNLFAAADGLTIIAAEVIDRVNAVCETITVATLPPFAIARRGQMLATVKIIPFAAPRAAVERCVAACARGTPLCVARLRTHRLGLVQTALPGTKASVLSRSRETIADRIAALGSVLTRETIVDHQPTAVARALAGQREASCNPILVLGASAITDRRDVIPAAVTELGGDVIHFGMPVEPGNLLLLAKIDENVAAWSSRLRAVAGAERFRLGAATAACRSAGDVRRYHGNGRRGLLLGEPAEGRPTRQRKRTGVPAQ